MAELDILPVDQSADDGFRPVRRYSASQLEQHIALMGNERREAAPLWRARLFQALSTSDFPNLTANVLNKRLLAEFQETPQVMERLFVRNTRVDFKSGKVIYLDGADGRLQLVPELGEYTAAQIQDGAFTYALLKWGRKLGFSWEAMINDDLNGLKTIPTRFARGSRRTIEWYLTQLFATTTGWLSTLFTASNGAQTSVATAALDAAGLAAGIQAMAAYTIPTFGEPILVRPKYLVVPPALEFTAYELTKSQYLNSIATGVGNSAATTRLQQLNYIANFQLEVLVNPWIPVVATSGTKGSTMWGLFTDPSDIAPGEISYLQGAEGPEIMLKAPNQQSAAGGLMDVMAGSFENDSIEYKIRLAMNAVALRPQSRYLSNGQ